MRVLYVESKRGKERPLLEHLQAEGVLAFMALSRPVRGIRRRLRSFRPNLILLEGPGLRPALGLLAARFLVGRRIPYAVRIKGDIGVQRAQGVPGLHPFARGWKELNYRCARLVLRHAAVRLPISRAIAAAPGMKDLPPAREHIVHIPADAPYRACGCGAPDPRHRADGAGMSGEGSPQGREKPQQEAGAPPAGRFLLTVTNFNLWEKVAGLSQVAEGIAPFLRAHGLRWLILGDGPFLKECRSLLASLEEEGLVSFLGHRDPWSFFGQALATLHHSRAEGLPNVLLESWSRGAPVIMNRDNPAREFVEDGVAGFLVDFRDRGRVEEVLSQVLAGGAVVKGLRNAGRRQLEERFSVARVAGELLRGLRLVEQGLESGEGRRALIVSSGGFNIRKSRLPLVRALRRSGWDVWVAGHPEGAPLEALAELGAEFVPLPVQPVGIHPFGDLAALLAVRRALRKIRPTLVHFFKPKPVLLGGVAVRLPGWSPRTFSTITGLGTLQSGTAREKLILGAYRWALRPISGVFFENPGDEKAVDLPPEPEGPRRFQQIASGVDVRRFVPGPGRGARARGKETSRHPRLLFAGRLVRDKGLYDVLAAMELLARNGGTPPVELWIAGGGVAGVGPEEGREAVEEAARAGRVRYLGSVRLEEMSGLLQRVDGVVLPSYREGCPKVLMEAAAAGLPVIASEIPGCRVVVEAGETGWLVPPGDPEALARAIGEFAAAEDLREKFGAAARARAARSFDEDELARRTIAAYRACGVPG